MNELISVEDLNVYYSSKDKSSNKPVLSKLSFNLNSGEILGVLGSSGAGKSSLIKAIAAYCNLEGAKAQVLSHDLLHMVSAQKIKLRQEIGYIFQEYSLIESCTAVENVLFARLGKMNGLRSFLGLYPKAEFTKACEALRAVDMEPYILSKVSCLSGGQKQRVAIARVLYQHPQLILADEPVSSLDPARAEIIMSLLCEKARSNKIGVLVNLHDVDLALKYCDKILALKQGKIFLYDEAKKLSKQELEASYV